MHLLWDWYSTLAGSSRREIQDFGRVHARHGLKPALRARRAPRRLCQPHLQSLHDQGPGDTLVPHRLDDRQVHQPYFLEDDPETEIPDNRDRTNFVRRHPLCQKKMCKGIAAQFRLLAFCASRGPRSKLLRFAECRVSLDGCRLNDPLAHHHSPRWMLKNPHLPLQRPGHVRHTHSCSNCFYIATTLHDRRPFCSPTARALTFLATRS